MGSLKHLSIEEQEFYIMKDDMKVEYDYEMRGLLHRRKFGMLHQKY